MRVPEPGPDGVRRFGAWAGNPDGYRENPNRCAVEVFPPGRGVLHRQCERPRGHGPGGLYCSVHDPERKAKREAKAGALREARWALEASSRVGPAEESARALAKALADVIDWTKALPLALRGAAARALADEQRRVDKLAKARAVLAKGGADD